MKNKSIAMSSKTLVLVTTLTLSLSYIGLVMIYAEGLASNSNHISTEYGRNDTKRPEYSIEQDPESLYKLKIDLEKQLRQTNLMLNVIEDNNENKQKRQAI